MADGVNNIAASFVFCMDSGISRAWNDLEYGVDHAPYWSGAVGWIGPKPPRFIESNGGESRGILSSHEEAQDLYDKVCDQGVLGDSHDQKFNLTTDRVKIVVVIKVDADGNSENYDELKWSVENFNLMNVGSHPHLVYEALVLVFQDRRPVEPTRKMAEEIRGLLRKKHGNNPPKIFISTTDNEQGVRCAFNALDHMAACILHFAVEQDRWDALDDVGKAGLLTRPQNKINSQISAIGLRGFFWERVRAIDISRGEHLRNFGNKWLEGDGWKDVMEKYPSDWPDNIVAWQKLLWAEMKEVWEDRDNVPTSDTMEEEVVKVVGEVNEELDFQLKNLLRAGNADKATRDKIIRRILNLISIIIDKRVNDLFKALPVAIESVKEQTRQSFEEWQKGLLQKGVGFSVLRRHYATSIKAISKIHKEASQHKTQFDHPGIMRLVRATVEAREKIPATESSFFSTVTTFSFLLCLFFYLSEIVFGYGLLTRLLISTGLSLGISVSIIYFYLKKQSDITNALWRDLSEMVTENTGSLMRHRLNRALADIIDGTNDKPGAKQLMVEQEKALIRAIEAGRRERDDFLRESNNKIPDQIQTVFSHSQNPADASYTPNWDRDMENKTDEWAKSYWYNRKFEGDVPDNFTPLWQQMSEDHREFLLKELTGYNLGVDAIQANVWNKLKNSTFRAKIPRQAVIDETLVKGQFRQYSNQVYAPSEWKKDVMAHVEEHGDPVTYQEVQNENAICIFSIIDGLEWNALMSAAIPEVYILKPGDGETSEQAKERGLLDLHEVRRELNSGNFSSNECFLWQFQKISGGATGKLNPVPDEKGNHQPTKAVGPHEKPTNIIVLSSHGLSTGHRVRLMADKGGAKEGADYYIRKIDDNSFKLYNTLVNAHEGHTGGAAALTACDDISFTLHENDITPGGQRAGQTGQKWEFLQKLDGKSRVLYYFPSLPEALASALADAVQRAKQRGDESDIILPPPPDSQL